MYCILYINCHFIWFYGQKLKICFGINLASVKQAEGTWFDTPVQFCLLNL